MLPVKISVGQSEAVYFYRLVFPDGKTLTCAVSPLGPDVAGRVIGTLTDEYTLFVPIEPIGQPWAFLRGVAAPVSYVQLRTQLPPWVCSLLGRLMILLTAARPADEIVDVAQAWYEGR
jgi:hypothetical protein